MFGVFHIIGTVETNTYDCLVLTGENGQMYWKIILMLSYKVSEKLII